MILEQIHYIRSFGAMTGRFSFSNLQWLKEGRVKRPASSFSALTSIIHMHGLHSHYKQSAPFLHT